MKGSVHVRLICSFLIFIYSNPLYPNRLIKIGLFPTPPFMYTDKNGGAAGLYVDTIKAVCSKMRIECRFKMMPYARGHKLLKNGGIDALAGPSKTPKRKKYGYYSPEHLGIIQYWGFFIRKKDRNKLKYEFHEDLKGYIVGSPRAYFIPPELKTFLDKHSKIDYIHSGDLNFKKLIKGRIDFVYSEINVGSHLAKQIKINDQILFLKKGFW